MDVSWDDSWVSCRPWYGCLTPGVAWAGAEFNVFRRWCNKRRRDEKALHNIFCCPKNRLLDRFVYGNGQRVHFRRPLGSTFQHHYEDGDDALPLLGPRRGAFFRKTWY